MTVRELYDRLGQLVEVHGDCDIRIETNESDREVASLAANVTDTEGDGFPFVLVRLEWDVPGTGGEIEWRDADERVPADHCCEEPADYQDDPEPVACPCCVGEAFVLGQLGVRTHYRCRQCGVDFSAGE